MKFIYCLFPLFFLVEPIFAGLNPDSYTLNFDRIYASEEEIFIDDSREIADSKASAGNQKVYPVKNAAMEQVNRDIQRGISLAATGTVIHFSGLFLQVLSIPVIISEASTSGSFPAGGFSLAIIGGLLTMTGPIPSCIGETIVHNSLDSYIHVGYSSAPRGWQHYRAGWVFNGASFLISFIGGFMAYEAPSMGMFFTLLSTGLGIAGEIQWAKAAIKPLIYSKKAEGKVHSGKIKIGFKPVIAPGKGFGMAMDMSF
ncbi:MAG: hypothetical protein GF401_10165 [Chitinivibrionales bacterium]|nr:hypothetical protein [Chitinivibrionales bacterium]